MAWLIQGKCADCEQHVGPHEEGQSSAFYCRGCNEYHTVDPIPRRFELPSCKRCGEQFREEDRLGRKQHSICPHCGAESLEWEVTMHMQMAFERESQPAIGDVVQGYVTNTGTIQRIEFVNSQMRGRLQPMERDFEDGTAVEAQVVGLGERSLDVDNVVELLGVPKRPMQNKSR